MDPRAKAAACLMTLAAVFWPGPVFQIAFVLPIVAVGIGVSGIPPSQVIRGVRPFVWFFIFAVVVHSLTTPGEVFFFLPLADVPVTLEGFFQGFGMSLRLGLAIVAASLLTMTTNPLDLVWAFERLASPLIRIGLPVRDFCVTLFFAMRFFPILRGEVSRLSLAAKSRGAPLDQGSLLKRVRLMSMLFVPLFRRVFNRAEAIAHAMEARGFQPGENRSMLLACEGFGVGEAVALGFSALTLLATCLLPIEGAFY